MELFRRDEVPTRRIPGDPEVRWYYTSPSDDFKVVVTQLPPGYVQNEHRHEHLLDIIYVVAGQVDVYERCAGDIVEATLSVGDMACFLPPCSHNMINRTSEPATTLTIKIVGSKRLDPDALKGIFDRDWIGYDDA